MFLLLRLNLATRCKDIFHLPFAIDHFSLKSHP
jgi:hypothetical protein